jgi:dolichol-phosphate mannosyltransferase
MSTVTNNHNLEEGLDVTIVLPTYNEEGNIARIIARLCFKMEEISKKFEILVMDDNSQDGTADEINSQFGTDQRVKLTIRDPNKRGLAFAIREGIELSKGEKILVMDTDFNHDPEVTAEMVLKTEQYDMVSGSRFINGGGMDSKFRWWCSLIFNYWIRILLTLPTHDNLAGFYCIKKEKINLMDFDQIFRNYGDYFFRLLFLARKEKISIIEIPVWYRNRSHGVSKTPFLSTLLLYTKESLKLRFKNL